MESWELTATNERIDALEKRIAALESPAAPGATLAPTPTAAGALPWAITALREHSPIPGGSVLFTGDVEIGGQAFAYQWERPTNFLLEQPWDPAMNRLAAIAHPIRGAILRRLLHSPATIAELVAEGVISSTGTGYHHLGALHGAGWTSKSPDGPHHIRPSRVIPLLSIIAAAEDH